ncbi:mukF [Acrasis kona]|uniref:MukF n=1 Tax=Acrasis kona TaxID=1008807 RepID=A0AAW2YHQ1_9EUKA
MSTVGYGSLVENLTDEEKDVVKGCLVRIISAGCALACASSLGAFYLTKNQTRTRRMIGVVLAGAIGSQVGCTAAIPHSLVRLARIEDPNSQLAQGARKMLRTYLDSPNEVSAVEVDDTVEFDQSDYILGTDTSAVQIPKDLENKENA